MGRGQVDRALTSRDAGDDGGNAGGGSAAQPLDGALGLVVQALLELQLLCLQLVNVRLKGVHGLLELPAGGTQPQAHLRCSQSFSREALAGPPAPIMHSC